MCRLGSINRQTLRYHGAVVDVVVSTVRPRWLEGYAAGLTAAVGYIIITSVMYYYGISSRIHKISLGFFLGE